MEKTSARWWDAPSAILLFLLILLSTWRAQATDWVEGLTHVSQVAILGLWIGLTLGQSRFSKRTVGFLSIAYMIVVLIGQWLGAIEFAKEQTYLGERLFILLSRVFTNVREFLSGRAIEDQFFIMALLCFPYWLVGLYSGYQLTRHANPLACVLPAAVLMFSIHQFHYTSKNYSWMFGAYLFIALLLIGRQKYIADRVKWLKQRVTYSQESGFDIASATAYVLAALFALAWLLPYTLPVNAQARQAWQNTIGDWFTEKRFERLLSSVNQEPKPQPHNFQTELSLGAQTSQSDKIVFVVYAPPNAKQYPRLYWRGQAFDAYENGVWRISAGDETRHNASRDINIPDTSRRSRLLFTFDIYTETQILLFAAAQPVWVNHDTIILHEKIPPSNAELDILTLRASPPLEIGDLVRVASMMTNPLVSELQNAGDDYPAWVTEKYLQLPEDFSPRIRNLALEITASAETPFDKAAAITSYLRREITYAPAITIPAEATDPLEYFLFERKRGFCNYSASVEVLMLRAVGVPARLAIGYAQGEANIQGSVFTVRERDLHAWPEVYFPQYGWVEFEPTGNQEPLNRPLEREEGNASTANPFNPIPQLPLGEEEQLSPEIEAVEEEAEETAHSLVTQNQIRWLGALGGLILLGAAIYLIKKRYAPKRSAVFILKTTLEKWNWKTPLWFNQFAAWLTLPSIERNFYAINTSLQWMGMPQPAHATPAERAQALQKALPMARDAIDILLREHQTALFSPHGNANEKLARRAARQILFATISARLKILIMGYN